MKLELKTIKITTKRWPYDTYTGLLISMLMLLAVFSDAYMLRLILSFPFMLFLPGYFVLKSIYPKNNKLSNIERCLYSIAVSIAISPIIYTVLKEVGKTEELSIILSILAVIISSSILSELLRINIPSSERYCLVFNIKYPCLSINFHKNK